MCMGSTPKVETPAPAPTMETAHTDDAIQARSDERKRMRRAVNSRSTVLTSGGGMSFEGRKTLLGE